MKSSFRCSDARTFRAFSHTHEENAQYCNIATKLQAAISNSLFLHSSLKQRSLVWYQIADACRAFGGFINFTYLSW